MVIFSLNDLAESSAPWNSSPIPGPKLEKPQTFSSRLFGVRVVPQLGTLTTSRSAAPNISTVQGLLDGGMLYGPRFQYSEFLTVRNVFVGVVLHFAFIFSAMALAFFPPIRWLVKRLVYAPGHGLTKEVTSKECLEYRVVATAGPKGPGARQAFAKLRWNGGIYRLTAVFLAEAAMVILSDEKLVQRLDGGLLTPAVLGQPFVDRMKNAGLVFKVGMLS